MNFKRDNGAGRTTPGNEALDVDVPLPRSHCSTVEVKRVVERLKTIRRSTRADFFAFLGGGDGTLASTSARAERFIVASTLDQTGSHWANVFEVSWDSNRRFESGQRVLVLG